LSEGIEPSLFEFLSSQDIDIHELYRGANSWIGHLQKIVHYPIIEDDRFNHLARSTKRLLHINSKLYLDWINSFLTSRAADYDDGFALMLYYDLWQKPLLEWGFVSLKEGLVHVLAYPEIVKELLEMIKWLKANLEQKTAEIELGYQIELEVYARYNRDEILASFGMHTPEKKYSSREGVLVVNSKNTELLFVTLDKSQGAFSATTSYEDYAVSQKIFHWQSQNSARPGTGAGLAYIHHMSKGKKILLFVRERTSDEYGFTMPFHFLGLVNYMNHRGEKPMSINWELEKDMPASLWEYAAKLSHG
jgi:hypothetical protein